MSLRAVIIGLAGALLIGTLGYVNNQVLMLERVAAGHLVPIAVFGALFVGLVVVNPLLGALRPTWRFRPAEIAVAVTLTLVGCSIPERGLMEQFTPTMIVPINLNHYYPGWASNGVLDYAHPDMLAAGGRYIPSVVQDFMQGREAGRGTIGLSEVPWRHWVGPLKLWLPLVGLMAVLMTCLALIVHRQWAYRERLRYPIAEFFSSFLTDEGQGKAPEVSTGTGALGAGGRPGGIFHNRMFWIGLSIVLGIHLLNGLQRWHPGSVQIPLMFDFWALAEKWPALGRAHWSWKLLLPRIFPMAVAFSYFLASDVSLSLGVSQLLAVAVGLVLVSHGLDMSEDYMTGGGFGYARFGAYLAFALILLYVGRRFYGQLLKAAVMFRRSGDVKGYEAWACRVLLVGFVVAVVAMASLGLDWPFAAITVACMLLGFVIVSRISAETGLFFIKPAWQALGVLMGLLGTAALGPKAIVMAGMFCVILAIDPSQSLMPYLTNGLRICDRVDVRPGRIAWVTILTYGLVVAAAVVVVLWANYNYGIARQANWSSYRAPSMPFRAALPVIDQLKQSLTLDHTHTMTWAQRWAHMEPTRRFLGFAGAGFVLVLIASALRLRFAWWPLHPVLFLVWYTWPMATLHHSFLLGWLVKTAVTRLGGGPTYGKLQPFMVGVIAGELLGGLTFMVVGAVYYFVTGLQPIRYTVLPV